PFASDVPFFAKLNGVYEAPYGIRVGANYQYIMGTPLLTYVLVSSTTTKLTQTSQAVITAPFGTTRLPNISTTDLNFTKVVRLSTGVRIQPLVNIFNLFNRGTALSELGQVGPPFGNALTILGARLVKLGVTVDF